MTDTIKESMLKYVKTTCEQVSSMIDSEIAEDDFENLEKKLLSLGQISASMAKAQAYAKQLLGMKQLQIVKGLDKEQAPSLSSRQLDAECFEEAGRYEYCQRLSAGISHSMDGIRTVLSFAKSDIANQKIQT